MIAFIVSPSALLRTTLKEVLAKIPGNLAIFDLGSSLHVERLLNEKQPQLVFWDEALETAEIFKQASMSDSFHLVLIRAKEKMTVNAPKISNQSVLEKMDFATVSVDAYAEAQLPRLSTLIKTIEKNHQQSATDQNRSLSGPVRLVVIGASTGGPAATKTVLQALPGDFPCPIALVQHIDTGYESGYADWLAQNTRLRVRLAKDGDAPIPGEVIVAPTERHLICRNDRFVLDDGPKIYSQKPAVDQLFATAAPIYRQSLVGILLTGIGADGATGCQDILQYGGYTLVQDEATSVVYGMPKAAFERGAASRVLPVQDIGPQLLAMVQARAKS
jgi:chemotaxis response regulator CheB